VRSEPLGVVEALCREMEIDVQDILTIKPDNDVQILHGDLWIFMRRRLGFIIVHARMRYFGCEL